MAKRKKRLKHRVKSICFCLVLTFLFFAGYKLVSITDHMEAVMPLKEEDKELEERKEKERLEQLEKQKERDYQACLNKPFSDEEMTDALVLLKQDVDNVIINNHYKTSIYYEDLLTGFSYTYDASKVYYGCSLIKIVDALYLINKAILGEIDLDTETVTYTSKYEKAFSSEMSKKSFGEKVSLRDLITYAVQVSDNSAHLMLIDYIGFNNLKAYGQSLGAKVILSGGDKFGNQTANDTNIYLKEVYRIIEENEEYGAFLKSIMDNDDRNAFNTEDIRVYHKYGSYADNYHDIGLRLIERPYAISILTLHEKSGYQNIVQTIHSKIINLHNTFYESRKNSCNELVYGK